MRSITLFIVILIPFSFSRAVSAGDTDSALKRFGLIGSFSADCSRSIEQGGSRATYEIPLSGEPTVTTHNPQGIFKFTIKQAIIVSGNEIIALNEVSEDGKQAQVYIKKEGTGIRIIHLATFGKVAGVQIIDNGLRTSDGSPSPIEERCGN